MDNEVTQLPLDLQIELSDLQLDPLDTQMELCDLQLESFPSIGGGGERISGRFLKSAITREVPQASEFLY
jgi:hypothetical protein